MFIVDVADVPVPILISPDLDGPVPIYIYPEVCPTAN
jgi:hypothetical protein